MTTSDSTSPVSRAMMLVAVCCAVLTTGLVVRRELFTPAGPNFEPREVADWEQYLTDGHTIGDASAPVKLITFLDFQCPFCKKFAEDTWPAIQEEFGDSVALVVRHWPLEQHSSARSAARAAECAGAQKAFVAYHDALFAEQSAIGVKSYVDFARDAEVQDISAFEKCLEGDTLDGPIESGIAHANELDLVGTPAVLVNRHLLSSVGNASNVAKYIRMASAEHAAAEAR